MHILLILLISGLLLCVFVNFISFTHYAFSIIQLIHLMNLGLGMMFFAVIGISKNIFKGAEKRVPIEKVKNICPEWMYLVMGCIIIYGTIMFIISSFRIITSDSQDMNLNPVRFDRGLSAMLMVLYAIGFLVLYGFTKIIKNDATPDINSYDGENDRNTFM